MKRGKIDQEIHVLCIWRKQLSSFKEYDYEILNQAFNVSFLPFKYSPLCILKMFFLMRKNDVAYAWFANVWAFLMVLFAKVWGTKTVIVAGGIDVANMPEIHYGLPQHPILKHVARYALKNADLVLSFSKFSQQELLNVVIPKQNELVYCCVKDDEDKSTFSKRKDQVVTAGLIGKKISVRKGHFEFIEVARHMPDTPFLHIGRIKDKATINELKRNAPPNVEYLGYLSAEKYAQTFLESKVYLQLSKHEGFGVSVVEAMQHGCTPVVSNAGALPEVVGSSGIVLDTWDSREISRKIQWVFDHYEGDNLQATKRAKEFSRKRRAEKLIPLIQQLAAKT